MNWKRYTAGLGALVFAASAAAQTNFTPVFQFSIFYNSLLEFTWCAPFTVNGRVHANGDIYTGSIKQLTFNSLVTTTGAISSPAWFGHSANDYTNKGTFNVLYSTNFQALTLSIGTNSAREIINQPPNGEDPNSALGQQRYYNKANLVLLVSNSTITLTLKSSPSDPQATSITTYYYPTNSSPTNYVRVTTNFPFLNVTNVLTDQREDKLVKVTDIDMSILKKWLVTNAFINSKFPNTTGVYNISNVPNILYAADNRSYTTNQLTAVRLKNGQIIPTNLVTIAGNIQPSGFTVATPNPLYVKDQYNCPNSSALGTTNTTAAYPASLVSDALTILSGNWDDRHSNDMFGPGVHVAKSTTVNAAILTGVVYSTGSGATQYSGGVQNLARLLEDWGNGGAVTLTLNTSIVNFFSSVRATNQFENPGNYYYAPTRQFSFDLNFLDLTKLPPGTPLVGSTVGPTAPGIVTPPLDLTVFAGQTAVFNVSATGNLPLFYYWRFNSTTIPNANTSTLTITNASAANAGFYSVGVLNAFGYQTRSNVLLTVISPPVINAPPVSQAALQGSNAQFSVSADGTAPLAYQWQFKGTNLAGATDATLVLTNVMTDQAGAYGITVTNLAGAASASATLSVFNSAAAILTAPPGFTGDGFPLTITGVPGLNYVVEASTNLVDWVPLSTNTSPFTFVDGEATNCPARYYRSVYLP